MTSFDLRQQRVITMEDIGEALRAGAQELLIREGAILTPSARDAISEKKLRLLPAKCKVYDLINLASEVSTHHAKGMEARTLEAWLGSTISDEYDLEGTDRKKGDFAETFIPKTN